MANQQGQGTIPQCLTAKLIDNSNSFEIGGPRVISQPVHPYDVFAFSAVADFDWIL